MIFKGDSISRLFCLIILLIYMYKYQLLKVSYYFKKEDKKIVNLTSKIEII